MNILLLNWRDPKNPLSGGAEYVTHMHCKAWVRNGHAVSWFSSSFPGAATQEVDSVDGVRFIRRGNKVTVFLYAWQYYLMHRTEFDLIVDEVHGIPFFAKFYAHIPIIVFVHEIAGIIWDVMYPLPISWIGKMLERFYIRLYRGNYFWTDAESTRQELLTLGVPPHLCRVIPCPIGNSAVSRLPKKSSQPTFLFVGRIVRMKGPEDILATFDILLHKLPNARLWMVGDGEKRYVDRLRDMAKRHEIEKHIVWWGLVSEKKKLQLMQKAHLLLHASVKEGWGLVVLEAASQGTPTVAYPAGGLTDTIVPGQTGMLTDGFAPEQLADHAFRVYTDKSMYAGLQKKCISWSTSFTWEDATKRSLALLHDAGKSL